MARLYKYGKLETTFKITGANLRKNLTNLSPLDFSDFFSKLKACKWESLSKKQQHIGGLLDECLSLTHRAEDTGNSSRLPSGARDNKMLERLYALFILLSSSCICSFTVFWDNSYSCLCLSMSSYLFYESFHRWCWIVRRYPLSPLYFMRLYYWL